MGSRRVRARTAQAARRKCTSKYTTVTKVNKVGKVGKGGQSSYRVHTKRKKK